MRIGLDLMVFFMRDENIASSEIGIEVPLENSELRLFTFYNIDYISMSKRDNAYTVIGTCGDEFICDERYEVVKHKIEQINLLRFN